MKLNLIAKKTEVPGVVSFIFAPEAPMAWKAGQYAHYLLPHESADDRGTERWFTIASAPFENTIMITTRLAETKGSTFKTALNALEIGESIESDYVEGDFVIDDIKKEYVCIAGGIGITPFHSILKESDHEGTKLRATLLYGNRDENIVFKDELDAWAKNNPDLVVHYLISPERIDEQAITTLVRDLEKPLFYISGPKPMVASVAAMLEQMGIAKERVKTDDFPGYPAE